MAAAVALAAVGIAGAFVALRPNPGPEPAVAATPEATRPGAGTAATPGLTTAQRKALLWVIAAGVNCG